MPIDPKTGKRRELTREERLPIAMEVSKGGKGIMTRVALKYNVSKSTVCKLMKKAQQHKTIENLKRKGRKKKVTPRMERRIMREVDNNNTSSSRQIKESLSLPVSPASIRRCLNSKGVSSRFSLLKPFINEEQAEKRLAFALKYHKMPLSFWRKVVFSDESKFQIHPNRKKRVWRRKGIREALKRKNIIPTKKYSPKINVWGCFSYHGVGSLVEIEGNMDGMLFSSILHDHLEFSIHSMGLGDDYVFQQDNDPKHTSKWGKHYLEVMNVTSIPHPPQSPDLNPIENLWNELDKMIPIDERQNLTSFRKAMHAAWDSISHDYMKSLVDSMPRRLEAVITAKGYHTKY